MNNCKIVTINLVRGDTLIFTFEAEGVEISNAFFSCKNAIDDTTNYVFQKKLNDGITLVDAKKGKYQVRVAPNDTKDVEVGSYYYDLQLNSGNDVFTVLKGVLKIDYEVTRGV